MFTKSRDGSTIEEGTESISRYPREVESKNIFMNNIKK